MKHINTASTVNQLVTIGNAENDLKKEGKKVSNKRQKPSIELFLSVSRSY